ncbi:MAG: tetratricopeptide repeat protein [Terracidiphilus sp.]
MKFNLACGSLSSRMTNLPMMPRGKLALIAVLAAVSLTAARTAGQQSAEPAPRVHSNSNRACPSRDDVDAALGQASTLMQQARYHDAAEVLKPLSSLHCDARASLLLAAAFEAGGDLPQAEQTLQRAHSLWPSNTSIAASLAREYLGSGQTDKAAQALAHFHATPTTPQQEMELAVVVYLAAHQLVSAQAVAEAAYKSYPSVHTLLMLANALQLQGRYPDVNRLLGDKRKEYENSPEFLITLAESESDASINPAAREDLEHAIALDPRSYQAHYLLGNVLSKLNDAERAIAEYRLAIDLAPDQPRTYFQLALILRSKQDQAGEELALEQALAADDHYAPAHCELGRMLLEEHRLQDAVSHLSSAIQYNPRSEEAYFLLARAYAGLGEKDKSDEMVKRLVIARKANRPNSGSKNGSQPAAN